MFKRKIRIIVNILLIVTLIFLTACEKEFSFRGSHFGDSVEQVQQNESNVGEVMEDEDCKYLNYDNVATYNDYTSGGTYYFIDDKLIFIFEIFDYYNSNDDRAKIFEDIKKELSKYGSPTEEAKEDKVNTALWEADNFGIVLFVTDEYAILFYSAYPDRARECYNDPGNSCFHNLLNE